MRRGAYGKQVHGSALLSESVITCVICHVVSFVCVVGVVEFDQSSDCLSTSKL